MKQPRLAGAYAISCVLGSGCLTIESSWISTGKGHDFTQLTDEVRMSCRKSAESDKHLVCRTVRDFLVPNTHAPVRKIRTSTTATADEALVLPSGYVCVPSRRGPLCGWPSVDTLRRASASAVGPRWAFSWPGGLCIESKQSRYDCLFVRHPPFEAAKLVGSETRISVPRSQNDTAVVADDGFCICPEAEPAIDRCVSSVVERRRSIVDGPPETSRGSIKRIAVRRTERTEPMLATGVARARCEPSRRTRAVRWGTALGLGEP